MGTDVRKGRKGQGEASMKEKYLRLPGVHTLQGTLGIFFSREVDISAYFHGPGLACVDFI